MAARAAARQAATLEELRAIMNSFEGCALRMTAKQLVFGDGSKEARLMFVGEAPGSEEDQQGIPFIGRSGQLLDQILQSVQLDPEQEVFITNAVFRLPPGDDGKPLRKPTSDEIVYYKPYLMEIIRLVNPAIMLLTGNVATESLLGQTGITKLRGQWFQWNGRWAMPIFHPAYLLRNPSREPGSPKALMWQDVREARRKYDEIVGGDR